MKIKWMKMSALMISLAFSGSLWAEPISVVSSFSILGDVAQQIGGERVQVSNLVPADGDAHAYQLTGGDVKKLANAKLILINGLGLETGDVVRAVKNSKITYAEATAGISPIKHEEHEEQVVHLAWWVVQCSIWRFSHSDKRTKIFQI